MSKSLNVRQKHLTEELLGNYKLTPATLGVKLDPTWIPKPFLTYISMKIAKAVARGYGRLLISVPPRHGKSQLATIFTSAWFLENFPNKNVVLTTYGADLSTDFGRATRDIIEQNPDLFNVRLRQDSKKVSRFQTNFGGAMMSVGLGGPITGRGADLLLIDDYIKEIKEAESKTYRNYVYNWFTTTAMSRREPGCTVIIIATRWHHDDLIGRLLKKFRDDWELIEIPALAYDNCPFGRIPGEPLFPERFPLWELQGQRRLFGSHWFDALYQQRPHDTAGSLSNKDWIETVDSIPNKPSLRFARIWDLAGTAGGGDYTVGMLLVLDPDTFTLYILHITRKQVSSGQVELLAKNAALSDGLATTVYIEQEPGSSGKALIENYQNHVLPAHKVIGVPSTSAKQIRAQAVLAAAEFGKVKMLRGKWNDDFLDEMDDFPDSDFDDQMDCLAIGYNMLMGKKLLSVVWGRQTAAQTKASSSKIVTGVTWGRPKITPAKSGDISEAAREEETRRARNKAIMRMSR